MKRVLPILLAGLPVAVARRLPRGPEASTLEGVQLLELSLIAAVAFFFPA